MSNFKELIKKVLENVTGIKDPEVDFASSPDFGDYSSNISLQMAKEKGNFLENIEWLLKNVKKNNWKDNKFNLPVGRLNPKVVELIKAKSDLIYLNGFIYSKINGWLGHREGHKEVLSILPYLPYICAYPLEIYEDNKNNKRNLFSSNLEKFGVVVIEVLEEKDKNEIVTIFFVNPRRLKNGILGKYRIPSLQAPVKAAGASFSGLQEIHSFYSKLEAKSQGSKAKFSLNYEIKRNPRELAEEYVTKLQNDQSSKSLFEKIEVAGPGFINFYLKKDILIDNLIQISKQKDNFGKSLPAQAGDLLKGKKIMFEYAHPNTHKAFHIGHLRNITTGETLSRLHEAIGAGVIRTNYQGDVGLHIAKAIYGIKLNGFEDPKDVKKRAEYLGKVYAVGATKFEESDEAKEIVGEINKKIYDKSDVEINKLYETTRKWSLDYFESIYKRVYTKFDRLYFESETAERGKEIAEEAVKKGVLVVSNGAIIFEGSKYGLHDRVFVSGKGVPTYEAKDFGLVELQLKEFDPDKIIHVLGPEQLGYTSVIFKAQELVIPESKGRQLHLPYGWVKLKEGKMSSRTGNVVLGEDILNQAKQKILASYRVDEETAEKIAVGAVKYSFLKTSLAQEISFDINESISLEGNSGPYLQYAYARIQSVLKKFKSQNLKVKIVSQKLKLNTNEEQILRKLAQFPEVIVTAAKSYSPNLLCNYLYDLASKFNSFYNAHKIIGSENEAFRVLLTSSVGQILKNGLNLLGIEAPERM